MTKFERIVKFDPAYDKRDPDPKKNFGIHGVELRMVLKGPKGAVQFVLFTNWMLPHVTKEHEARADFPRSLDRPLPADLGYHSYVPVYEGQSPIQDSCAYLEDGPCYYDGSGLNADRIYKILLEQGSDGVWKELEKYYEDTFKEVAEPVVVAGIRGSKSG